MIKYWTGWVVHIGCTEPSRQLSEVVDGGRDHQAGKLES